METPRRSLVDTPVFSKTGSFEQVDLENGIAYGFAIVCTENNKPYFDLQDDHIPEEEMTKAAIEFFSGARAGKDQHSGDDCADIVFGMPMTKAIQQAEGISCRKTGLWIGYQPQDPVQLDMIASGERTGFSIGGVLIDSEQVTVGKAVWSTAYQNKLPDSAFLYVSPGGKKDSDGNTTPRSLRHFPVKDADGNVDRAHVDNALARVAGAKIPAAAKEKVKSRAQSMLASLNKAASLAAMTAVAKGYGAGPSADQDAKPGKKGRVFRTFKIREISLVDRPAQEGATVSVVKSLRSVDISKDVVLTSTDDGHQHVVSLEYIDPEWWSTSYATSDAEVTNDATHNHRLVIIDGKVTLADNAGHGHTVAMPDDWEPPVPDADEPPRQPGVEVVNVTSAAPRAEHLTDKNQGDTVATMTDAEIKALQNQNSSLVSENGSLKDQLAKALKLADLTDAERHYHKGLDVISGPIFLAKSAVDRRTEVDGAVLGKSADGSTYYRGQEQLWSLAQKNDRLEKSIQDERGLRIDAEIAKRAIEFESLQGTEAVTVAVIKALDGIADAEVRKAAFAMLKGATNACEMLTKASGHQNVPEEVRSTEGAFYQGVEKYAKDKGLPYVTEVDRAKASSAFMKTSDGGQLYKAFTAEQDRIARAGGRAN